MHDVSQLPDRIAAKIKQANNGCWVWQGWCEKRRPRKLRYGKVWWEGTMRYAHRIVYTLLVGEIPEGMCLDHLCSNASCVNPSHLDVVTQAENIRRGNSGKVQSLKCECGTCVTCKNREYMRSYRERRRSALSQHV